MRRWSGESVENTSFRLFFHSVWLASSYIVVGENLLDISLRCYSHPSNISYVMCTRSTNISYILEGGYYADGWGFGAEGWSVIYNTVHAICSWPLYSGRRTCIGERKTAAPSWDMYLYVVYTYTSKRAKKGYYNNSAKDESRVFSGAIALAWGGNCLQRCKLILPFPSRLPEYSWWKRTLEEGLFHFYRHTRTVINVQFCRPVQYVRVCMKWANVRAMDGQFSIALQRDNVSLCWLCVCV